MLDRIRLFFIKRKIKKLGDNLSVMFPFYLWCPNVIIGNNVKIFPNVTFWGEGDIIIDDNVKIGHNVIINVSKGSRVHIGSDSLIAANTYIIDSNHAMSRDCIIRNQGCVCSPIEIGSDVWIGASCVIGKGAAIQKGAVIAANSFVNSEIPEYSVAMGTPALVKKYRE